MRMAIELTPMSLTPSFEPGKTAVGIAVLLQNCRRGSEIFTGFDVY